jgi:CheY-like chemotaxis protein
MMGGDLTAQSEPGKGSTFTITLPADVPPVAADGSARTPSTTRQPIGRVPANAATVLVIDDEPNARELIERMLTKEGYRVALAADGKSGLALAQELKPAVITLDVMMPGMDGWAVLNALKADPATADIPVIMVTIVDDKGIGFTLGAADYFTKPIDWPRLLAVLKKYRKDQGGQTVLVVEDEAPMRELLRRTLEKEGWRVIEAENGRQALERLADAVPAVILLDLMMPEMDGFAFMQAFHQRADCRQVPVIVITAKDVTEEDRRRLDGQVTRILQKGATSNEELVGLLRELAMRQA